LTVLDVLNLVGEDGW